MNLLKGHSYDYRKMDISLNTSENISVNNFTYLEKPLGIVYCSFKLFETFFSNFEMKTLNLNH